MTVFTAGNVAVDLPSVTERLNFYGRCCDRCTRGGLTFAMDLEKLTAKILRQVVKENREILAPPTFKTDFLGFFHAVQWTEVSVHCFSMRTSIWRILR